MREGNTNAVTHGATTATAKRGILPAGYEHLQPTVDYFFSGWLEHCGGEKISRQREGLLWTARAALVVSLLALEHVRENGFTDSKGKPQPILTILATYLNSLRLSLVAAGLEKQSADMTPQTLREYMEQRQ